MRLELTKILVGYFETLMDNIFIVMNPITRSKVHSSHIESRPNRSFRVGGSLAEENDVRNFNRARNNKSMAPSMPHRI